MSRQAWSGIVATIVALSVGLSFVVAMIGVTVQDDPVSTQGAALLNTLGGGLIAVLSLWIGGQVEAASNRERNRTMSTTTPEPQDPATNPDRNLTDQPQDPDAPGVPDEDTQPDVPQR